MIELLHQIEQIDTQIFLFFNGFHNEYWDYFMMIFSDRFVWVPFYASFIFVLLKNFPVKVVMSTIVVITLIILFSDQTASGILKPLVARMRPSNPDNPISPMVHVVQGYRGGRYGFPSSHAAKCMEHGLLCTISGSPEQTHDILMPMGIDNQLFPHVSRCTLFWRHPDWYPHWFFLCHLILLYISVFFKKAYRTF